MQRRATGVPKLGTPVFVGLLFFCVGGAAHAQDQPLHDQHPEDPLREIVDLARAGAAQLAVQAMDARQPDRKKDLQGWLRWERERAFVLLSQGRWQALADRLADPPAGLPTDFYDWAREMRARAFLRLGRGDAARRELGRNIWSRTEPNRRDDLARRRRLIIETYLADGLDEDADRAMIRYRQDYGDAGEAWPLLRAQVLLRTDRPDAALRVLPDDEGDADTHILRQLARLRSGAAPAKTIRNAANALLASTPKDAPIRAAAWALSAEAAQRRDNLGGVAKSLEGALGQAHDLPPGHPLAKSGDDLWAAYRRYGLASANRVGLLIGDEDAWFAMAEKTIQAPVRARSLLAALALEGTIPAQRRRAHAALARNLLKTNFGPRLLPRLYLNTQTFPTTQDIPAPVRHILADIYLDQGRILDASALVTGLEPPPEGADPFEWPLRRSRILLLAGRVDEAHAGLLRVLDTLSNDAATAYPEKIARFLQVVFDLQAVERHDLAQPIFRRLLQAPLDIKQRRELYFWSGESAEALGNPREAALLYLRSAMDPSPFAMDPWAQTARFQAARLLAEQGLIEDARTLYRGLLDATQDPARRAVLRQRIQQLMLQRHGNVRE